jgi:hypothetical protein
VPVNSFNITLYDSFQISISVSIQSRNFRDRGLLQFNEYLGGSVTQIYEKVVHKHLPRRQHMYNAQIFQLFWGLVKKEPATDIFLFAVLVTIVTSRFIFILGNLRVENKTVQTKTPY